MTIRDLGRNDPCHCGSGRKYKQCCLAKDEAAAREARAEAEQESGTSADAVQEPAQAAEPTKRSMPPKGRTHQPWKRSATNTHGFQRMSAPRKVGGS